MRPLFALIAMLSLAGCDGMWVRSIEIAPAAVSGAAQAADPASDVVRTVSDVAKKYGYRCQPGQTGQVDVNRISRCERTGPETIDVLRFPDAYEIRILTMHPGPVGDPPQSFISMTDDLAKALSSRYGDSVRVTDDFVDHAPAH